jgi:hypothetical protein
MIMSALARAWEEVKYRLGVNRLDAVIWRWQDRRRAGRLDELASLADSAGLPGSAAKARAAAARARLRTS